MAHLTRRATRSTCALVVLAMAWGALGTAEAQTSPASRERELEMIRERVRGFRQQLSELDAASTSVDAELRRLRLEVRLQQQLLTQATTERGLAENALRQSELLFEAMSEKLARTQARLGRRVFQLYKAAPTDWIRGFITVRASDFFLYVRTLRFLARRDAVLVPVYREERAALESERLRLSEREREVARSVARERSRLGALEDAKRRQSLVAKALQRERGRVERAADSLDDKERKLALLIAVLAQRDAPLSGKRIQDFRGALDWPTNGTLSVPFGPRYEARYGTSVPHNGVEIASDMALVSSVFPGVVIFAAPFEGFGLTVVVHHFEQVFSLYAGLEELKVSKGDVVSLDQVLGQTGSALYFEIRVENRPEDPMDWLR